MMMSELFSKSNDGQIQQNGLIISTDEVIDYLNTSNNAIGSLQYENAQLRKENKRLKERNDELATALEEGLIKVANYQKQQVTLRKLQEKVKRLEQDKKLVTYSVGDVCKEVQRIRFDIENKDYVSAIDRCNGLDELLYKVEEGEYGLVIDEGSVRREY